MTKIVATIEGNELVVRVPLNNPPIPSQSGQNLIVASSYGNIETEARIDGRPIVVGLNAYISLPKG